MKKKQPIIYVAGAIVLYLLATGVSYGAFSSFGRSAPVAAPVPSAQIGQTGIDPSIPRTEKCPLNGALFTKQERDIWEKRRPLAVMIENHEESRPQSGLSYADIVYEAVAEGGITRFMGVFYCGVAAQNIGFAPVRSARTTYVDMVSEYDALYNHVGGAGNCNDPTVDERAKALCQIDKYGIKDLDQFGIAFPNCYRNYDRLDHPVATEHTMVCFSNKLYDIAQKRSWTNVDEAGIAWDKNFQPWKFKEEAKEDDRGSATSISFSHWDSMKERYGVQWTYDKTGNLYKRSTGGQPHLDLETKQQLTAKTIAIEFAKETSGIDEHAHVIYADLGEGKALIFQDGNVVAGTWKKPKRTSRTVFFDAKGKEMQFNPGQIWIEIVDTSVKVTY